MRFYIAANQEALVVCNLFEFYWLVHDKKFTLLRKNFFIFIDRG